jgi:hypothetical protein
MLRIIVAGPAVELRLKYVLVASGHGSQCCCDFALSGTIILMLHLLAPGWRNWQTQRT